MTLWSFEPHHLATLVLLGLAVVIVWAIGGGVRIYTDRFAPWPWRRATGRPE